MSVLIKNMKMPKDCYDCPLHDGENGECKLLKITVVDYIPKDCPLTEIESGGNRYINAETLLSLYNIDVCKEHKDKAWKVPLETVIQNIKDQPTADVRENVRGEWKNIKTDIMRSYSAHQSSACDFCVQCSVCGFYASSYYNFCPNCGADMRNQNND